MLLKMCNMLALFKWQLPIVAFCESIYGHENVRFTVHNVFNAFFEQKSSASSIQSTVAIKTAIKALDHVATNVSFEDENEGGDVVDSKTDNNSGTANAVEAKVINNHAEQETTDDVALPPTAKYTEIWIH
ncbi:hypothetical protein MAM1_0094d04980 [Mucor ambiguus]|uniref:Uncharacterized protein n=1 Tax=Mucor ambiguus TaxID=91626 RepID=A0A0C9MDV3_9FUNG|nr:hypothetical protein MAM1_0094d04980 [Mucor ambiguus]